MIYKFILNGEDVSVQSNINKRLIDVLRVNFGLFGAKSGCQKGQCGACTIFYNGQISLSCLIPAFRIGNTEIITIEGFSQTIEYQEILNGFKDSHLGNCGYCESGKILCTEALLDRFHKPSNEEILAGFSGIKCRCTNSERLIKAVNLIAANRNRRLHGQTF